MPADKISRYSLADARERGGFYNVSLQPGKRRESSDNEGAGRERHEIRRICVESLKLYRQVEMEMPQASDAERYASVIERRGVADPGAVRKLMRRAEIFASWPVKRPLNFRDIVHYIAVTDCLKTDISADAVHSRLVDFVFDIVPEIIPADL
jgi:hypothetical protein